MQGDTILIPDLFHVSKGGTSLANSDANFIPDITIFRTSHPKYTSININPLSTGTRKSELLSIYKYKSYFNRYQKTWNAGRNARFSSRSRTLWMKNSRTAPSASMVLDSSGRGRSPYLREYSSTYNTSKMDIITNIKSKQPNYVCIQNIYQLI